MSMEKIVSVSTAFAVAVGFVHVPLAEARGMGHFSAPMTTHIMTTHVTSHVASRVQSARILRTHVASKHVSGVLHRKPTKVVSKLGLNQGGGKLNKTHISKLPVHNNLTNNKLTVSALSKGRLAVPLKLKPKFTLTKLPNPQFQKKMGPFVQKLWKKPFFWVALAGIGYVTVPEFYYPNFLTCIEDEDYDGCVNLLSIAALEDAEDARVRYPMPATARYRYSATVAPSEVARVNGENGNVRSTSCSFEPFVERKWNTAFVWVRIPETGNVTVPEEYYDRFQSAVTTSPPNYQAACSVLVEAANADMMTIAGTVTDTDTNSEQVN